MSIIKVENISKKYIIRHETKSGYSTIREDAIKLTKKGVKAILSPFFKKYKNQLPKREDFWALKDINFEIEQGDRVGIIGRNGSGKSTLLKILSRITEPSKGRFSIKGRVASLLEVGTGFHPELTGRENIFLNGAILGMGKQEIKRKFDEIVAFSEVEKFLDTPVKRYSSGMYVRLAFSVAAHLEPEILIIDEVLAVGDAAFQKKCLGKMEDVSQKEGRTILFVSHNMGAVKQICNKGLYLDSGEIKKYGETDDIIPLYFGKSNEDSGDYEMFKSKINSLPDDDIFKFLNIELLQNNSNVWKNIENGEPLDIKIDYLVKKKISGLRVYFDFCDISGNILFRSFNDEDYDGIPETLPGEYRTKVSIPANLLGPFEYIILLRATIHNVRSIYKEDIIIPLEVEHTGIYNRAYGVHYHNIKFELALKWELEKIK